MTNQNNYPAQVLEIHNEFQTAADKLLVEAKEIVQKAATINKQKTSRLERLGFKRAKEVVETAAIIRDEKAAKENAELVSYFSMRYPNNKFITEYQVREICHKYNLVCGEVGKFKGFVPEKNLKEIEAFSLKKEDVVYERDSWGSALDWSVETMREVMERETARSTRNSVLNYFSPTPAFSISRSSRTTQIQEGTPVGLKICAPVKDMDTDGYRVVDGYMLEKIHVPDPVVLQPVKGGYLILTAWGDEASDENVVNQKFN